MAVDNVGMDVPMKFGDTRSSFFRDIRGADFVSNELSLAKPMPQEIKKIQNLKQQEAV